MNQKQFAVNNDGSSEKEDPSMNEKFYIRAHGMTSSEPKPTRPTVIIDMDDDDDVDPKFIDINEKYELSKAVIYESLQPTLHTLFK